MSEETPQEDSKSGWQTFKETKFGKFCTDPAVALGIAILAIILSFVTSYYFYKISTKNRDLCYYVNPVITTIVQPNALSDLAVAYQGQPITNGFYGQQIAIWNEGKEAIETKDILQQIVIKPSPGLHVLQIKIAKRSRDLTGCQIATNTIPDAIGLTWNILEFRDGAVIQIFYTGTSKGTFTVEGALRDQPNAREWQVTPSKQNKEFHSFLFVTALISVLVVGLFGQFRHVGALDTNFWSIVYLLLLIATILQVIIAAFYGVFYLLLHHLLERPVPFGL